MPLGWARNMMFKAKAQGFLHSISCAVVVIFTLEPGHYVTGPVPNWQGLTEHRVPGPCWSLLAPESAQRHIPGSPGGGGGVSYVHACEAGRCEGGWHSRCREPQACWTPSATCGSILIASQRLRCHYPRYLNMEMEAARRPHWGVEPCRRPLRSTRLQSPPSWPCSPSR